MPNTYYEQLEEKKRSLHPPIQSISPKVKPPSFWRKQYSRIQELSSAIICGNAADEDSMLEQLNNLPVKYLNETQRKSLTNNIKTKLQQLKIDEERIEKLCHTIQSCAPHPFLLSQNNRDKHKNP